MATLSVGQLLRQTAARLTQSGSPQLDAELLLAQVMGVSRSGVLARLRDPVQPGIQDAYEELIARRERGEPVAYLLGRQGFWSLELDVTPDVLIPRPETELLVESCLEIAGPDVADFAIADLGTGSGAIALALAAERPAWRVYATDRSEAALAVATANARRLSLSDRIEFRQGDWCAALPDGLELDILVSNPPYIDPEDPHLSQGALPFEPLSALRSDEQGLRDIRFIVQQSLAVLKPAGWLLLEHGYNQGAAVRQLLEHHKFNQVRTVQDLAGLDRVTLGCRS
ncbi:peptide chain release factor N(5)-glutamine methyltransferase [Pseudohongiella sp. SYSU M77423]|uniref:peptide chain release factor N(5)-glutamine methyltransferase n=1 Tax=unclassified Pseudohongiella TaxID=2629611 RepID=UPI001EFF9477|nr:MULTISPECIES: peptide chain release factor N(5)-glutamine methyltransferase [unclassified Pseudohongiella]MDH7942420.1 peptide chain release factor N(5)-glutamine methyltransferase [Pseudohongiella sp. SYSU M77423]